MNYFVRVVAKLVGVVWDGRYACTEKKRRQRGTLENFKGRDNKRRSDAIVAGKLLSAAEITGQEGNKGRFYN